MDRATLDAHRSAWGWEDDAKRFNGALGNLTDAESALYEELRENRLAPALRLEQEHVTQGWLLDALGRLGE